MIHNRTVTALLPIKEHSARVTGKNFRDFSGKPLYYHIIHTLAQTYAVDEILVNTDSTRVINEASTLSPKVRVIERPKELCGDFVSTNKIFAYDLSKSTADIYVQTHATNPLLKAETIAKALSVFIEKEEEHDSLFGVSEYHSRFYSSDGEPINHDPDELIRTQDLPPLYEENSCIYIFTKDSFKKTSRRIGTKPYMFVTPRIESIDIDDEVQFKFAELLALYGQK